MWTSACIGISNYCYFVFVGGGVRLGHLRHPWTYSEHLPGDKNDNKTEQSL